VAQTVTADSIRCWQGKARQAAFAAQNRQCVAHSRLRPAKLACTVLCYADIHHATRHSCRALRCADSFQARVDNVLCDSSLPHSAAIEHADQAIIVPPHHLKWRGSMKKGEDTYLIH
jgi:hypothetical protein